MIVFSGCICNIQIGEIMNNCCFTGYLTDNPHTSQVGNVLLAEFTIVYIIQTNQKHRREE